MGRHLHMQPFLIPKFFLYFVNSSFIDINLVSGGKGFDIHKNNCPLWYQQHFTFLVTNMKTITYDYNKGNKLIIYMSSDGVPLIIHYLV